MYRNKLFLLLLVAFCSGCISQVNTDKYQNNRNNVCDVRGDVKEIKIETVDIGSISRLYLISDYLIVGDYRPADKLIHLFDRKNFGYLMSTTYTGQGPDEITIMGHIGVDEAHRRFFVSDHGKLKIFCYELDRLLSGSSYAPTEKVTLSPQKFPDRYEYINDTLSYGLVIEPIGTNNFNQTTARWNMNTGEITTMKYIHPKIQKKRIDCAVSVKDSIYVECYSLHDLMTICRLNGDLICNVYGTEWNDGVENRKHYYGKVTFCKDKIVASYSGGNYTDKGYTPTKFLIFDLTGNYLKTLEVGYRISDFCYDEKFNRILMSFDDEIQFGYLDLNGII